MRFKNREDAGRQLAACLLKYRDESPIVLALPRGGVPVAAEVAFALHAPLDILLVRKVGAPSQPELALGAVADGREPVVVRNREVMAKTKTGENVFQAICARELAEIERRRGAFEETRTVLDPKDRVTILVDDGIATGATMKAALQVTRARGAKKLILAVPVAAENAIDDLRGLTDDIVFLTGLDDFAAVGMLYEDFRQLEDRDVTEILARFSYPSRLKPPAN